MLGEYIFAYISDLYKQFIVGNLNILFPYILFPYLSISHYVKLIVTNDIISLL